ncbi:MAG: NAD(P)H-binding protein [Bryobacteraceae bacterium]
MSNIHIGNARPYLITGATGNIGSLVVERLDSHGNRPRVFVRDAAKTRARYGDAVDIFTGDLADATTLKPALDGVEALLLINSGPELVARDEAAAKVAKAAGVKHLVKLSSYDSREQNVGTGVWHARGEAAIRAAGIPFTFVQPSGFMVNALFWANSIKAEGVVRSSTGDGRIPFIHSDDIADVTTKALTTTQYIGESLTITGPEALSYAEMTAKIGSAIGKPLRFQPISDDEERQHLIALGEPEASVEAHLSIYRAIREGRLAPVTDTVERVLGRSPISFDRWVRENVAAFQPKSINRPDTRCS